MSLGDYFIAAGTVLYLGAAISYYWQGVFPLTALYSFYAGANVAAIWMAHWRVK